MTCLKTSCRFRWAGIGVGVTAVGVVDRDILPLNRTDILEVPGLEETFEHTRMLVRGQVRVSSFNGRQNICDAIH